MPCSTNVASQRTWQCRFCTTRSRVTTAYYEVVEAEQVQTWCCSVACVGGRCSGCRSSIANASAIANAAFVGVRFNMIEASTYVE